MWLLKELIALSVHIYPCRGQTSIVEAQRGGMALFIVCYVWYRTCGYFETQ